jgi:RNA polymerase sigma-70 factor (ECF subfamily)
MAKQIQHSGGFDLDALMRRERTAISAWFADQSDQLYAFVYFRVGRNEDVAVDVVQETFLSALENLSEFDPDRGSMFAWLTYRARNKIRSAMRKSKRYVGESDIMKIDAILLDSYHDIATAPLPDDILESEETAELVRITLSSIPSNYRTVLEDRYFENLTIQQISRLHNLSVGAARIA